MDLDVNFGIKGNTIQEILKMTYFMEKGDFFMLTGPYMMGNGRKENRMAKGF